MVSLPSIKISRVSMYSGYCCLFSDFAYESFTLYGWSFQGHSAILKDNVCSPNPRCKHLVWALSLSLAATKEIDVSFSSWGYLDVSVPPVPFITLWIHVMMTGVCPAGFPHSEICGSYGYLLLTAAYRSLSRLSSALSAKASTIRSFLLNLS